MAKPKPNVDVHRFRFNVPENDNITLEWLEAQSNPSMSLRLLIREDIAENGGVSDIFVRAADKMPISRKKRNYTPRGEGSSNQTLTDAADAYESEQMTSMTAKPIAEQPKKMQEVPKEEEVSEPKGLGSLASQMAKIASEGQNGGKSPSNDKSNIGIKESTKKAVNRVSAAEMGLM